MICNCNIRWLQISRIKLAAPAPRCESPPSMHGRIIDKHGPFNAECNERSKSSHVALQIFPAENQVYFILFHFVYFIIIIFYYFVKLKIITYLYWMF